MIKQKIGVLFLLLSLAFGFVQGQELSTISGTWDGKGPEDLTLYKVVDGRLVLEATSAVNENNQFAFAINQSESGFFVVGLNPTARRYKYVFYLKPGDRVNVDVDNKEFNYKLLGDKNSPENVELKRWFDASYDIQRIASYSHLVRGGATYVQFFPALDEILEVNKNYAVKESVEKAFATKFESFRKFDIAHTTLLLLYTPRSAHPQAEDYPEYIDKLLDRVEYTKGDELLSYPFGNHLVGVLGIRDTPSSSGLSAGEALTAELERIGNPVLKGDVVVKTVMRHATYESFMAIKTPFEKYLVTDFQKKTIRDREVELGKTAVGTQAINFKFKDKTGKEVALSDLKGKVVYIDIWATWCGPCLKEAPHWKTLYEKYKSKDIVFLGISTDNDKDYAKWLAHIEKEGEIGMQLFAGTGKEAKETLSVPYEIKGIPRFLLIGKKGEVIDMQAKRPSNPEIHKDLDEALAK